MPGIRIDRDFTFVDGKYGNVDRIQEVNRRATHHGGNSCASERAAAGHRAAYRLGILARAEQGYEVDQIANDIGMSRQNVEHYMRVKDQMRVAAQGQKRLRLVSNED